MPIFRQIQPKRLNDNHLAKPLKIQKFSTKSFLAQNFWIMEGLNGRFVNIFHVSPSFQVTSAFEQYGALFDVHLDQSC